MKKPKSWAEQLADLEDPAPRSFDPEDDVASEGSGDSASDTSGHGDVRDHYVEVEQGALRRAQDIDLGPEYAGAPVRRDQTGDKSFEDGLSEEEDELDSNGDILDDSVEDSDLRFSEASSASTASDEESLPATKPSNDREQIRKMLASERKLVASSLSSAVQADIDKGRAIQQQCTAFDALLNTRIKLQKSLTTVNTLPQASFDSQENENLIAATEASAYKLLDSLHALRTSLDDSHDTSPRALHTSTRSSKSIWQASDTIEESARKRRRQELSEWSTKLAASAPAALSRSTKFSQTSTTLPLLNMLDEHLSGTHMQKHISRSRGAQSIADAHPTGDTPTEDETVYDDTDFYTAQLRDLIAQRAPFTSTAQPSIGAIPTDPQHKPLSRPAKKRIVDTKASKGRKVRYTVHEKLLNFMPPEDRGRWGNRQRGELFGILLGRRNVDQSVADGDEDEAIEMDGKEGEDLRLFAR